LLITAGLQLDFINSQRYQMKLISNKPLENAPPSLAFATVAMGAFRGLVVDILWIRADRLKEQGQFFDAKQLAEWITTLQPRFPSVWDFHSWNMAYNISVAIPASQPHERWRWVKNGYELLRDQGIPLNPTSILLYRQLAMIFQHKIGEVTDEAHKYYKLQLALAMEPLVGSTDNQYFERLAKAPTDWEQIRKDANVGQILAALKSADNAFSDESEFVSNYLAFRENPNRFAPAAFNAIEDFRGTEAFKKLDIFAKAYQLRNVWKLDPVLMQQLNETYGPIDWNDPNKHLPLDWRNANTHGLYWAVRGLQMASKGEYSLEETNTDRMVGHSLQKLFRNGKMFVYEARLPEPSDSSSPPERMQKKEVFLRPDLRMFEPYNKSMLATLEKYKQLKEGTYGSFQDGHRNMLTNALLLFYQSGHIRQAQKIYNQLRKLYPRDEFKVPLLIFVRNQLREEFESIGIYDAKEMITGLLREAYFRYAMRDDDEASGRESLAKEVHNHYRSQYSDEDRIDLPEFKMLRYFALIDFLNDEQYSRELRLRLVSRIEIERPELARQFERIEEELLKKTERSEQLQ